MARHLRIDALAQNRLFVGHGVADDRLLIDGRLGKGRGRHLLAVSDDYDGLSSAHCPDRVRDPHLGGLIEYDDVERGGVCWEELGDGCRAH